MADTQPEEWYHPSQDERTLACVAHLTIFLSTIGLLIAIGLWVALRSKQPYAAFQAAQAVIFQFVTMILTFFVVFAALAAFFGLFGVGLASGMEPTGAAFSFFFIIGVMVIVGAMSIASLLLYVYAVVAAYRSWKGRRFRIPGVASVAEAISPMPRTPPEGVV